MRIYTAQFNQVLVSAPQDLFQVEGATGKLVAVLRVKIGATDTTMPTLQMLSFEGNFLPATVTNGSGGTTPAIKPTDAGDSAASAVVLANNTTAASSTGTVVNDFSTAEHIANGLDMRFAMPGSEGGGLPPARFVGPGESWVLKLLSTVSGTVHLSGTVWVAEIGG